jgi:hypothetical protein
MVRRPGGGGPLPQAAYTGAHYASSSSYPFPPGSETPSRTSSSTFFTGDMVMHPLVAQVGRRAGSSSSGGMGGPASVRLLSPAAACLRAGSAAAWLLSRPRLPLLPTCHLT